MTTTPPPRARRRPHAARGFTLVEVLVALFILAILSAMAFRGVDAISRSKDAALAATNRTLKLNTGMAQFEYDASQIIDTKVLARPIACDGASLRFVRRTPHGDQLVLWVLKDRRWQRWASPPLTKVSQLQDAWFASQQWDSISGNAVTLLDNVDDFQVYQVDSSGSQANCQSSGANPSGLIITLKMPEGVITRERELPPLPS